MSTCNIHLKDKRRKYLKFSPHYFLCRGMPWGLKNGFDSAMVYEPSVFEPSNFYCITIIPAMNDSKNQLSFSYRNVAVSHCFCKHSHVVCLEVHHLLHHYHHPLYQNHPIQVHSSQQLCCEG